MYGQMEEAEKCIEVAEKAIRDGDRDKAIRFLEKAERIYPTDRAKELLEKYKNLTGDSSSKQTWHRTCGQKNGEERFNATNDDDDNSSSTSNDHLDAIERIKKCKDYYEVLQVPKDATNSRIKKAYKKLALQLHPDKNKTPGAAEAFKAIGNAVSVLTDAEKRKQYDLYRCEEEKMASCGSQRSGDQFYAAHTKFFEGDTAAEEFLNMFFRGKHMGSHTPYTCRNGRWMRQSESHAARQQQNNTVLSQLLPVLVLIIISMMSSFFVSDPIYSLHASPKFPIQKKTQNLKVSYYVKENFYNEYQGNLRRLEAMVEEEYVSNLRNACYKEKSYKDTMIWKARNFDNKEMYARAQNQPTPSCEALMQLHNQA